MEVSNNYSLSHSTRVWKALSYIFMIYRYEIVALEIYDSYF
jgi:hypothetical protein